MALSCILLLIPSSLYKSPLRYTNQDLSDFARQKLALRVHTQVTVIRMKKLNENLLTLKNDS